MQIQNVNTKSNPSFGLLYSDLLSGRHKQLIRPVFAKIASYCKGMDLYLSTKMMPIEKGSDYQILSEGISMKAFQVGRTYPQAFDDAFFTNKYIGESGTVLQEGYAKLLNKVKELAEKVKDADKLVLK